MSALLDLTTSQFASAGTNPERVRHHLRDHPLLSVESVATLADRLPAHSVEHNVAKGIGAVVPGGAAPVLERSPGEVARGIEHNGCWMVLKNIEQDPQYSQLLNAALDEVAPLLPGGAAAMRSRHGFLFLSAPGSVTPAHVDPEHNFLLQVRGTKTMHVGRFATPDDEQRELERSFGNGHRNMSYVPADMTAYALDPGDGLYVPVGAPHWVANGPTVSVSLSITWRTAETLHAGRVHAFNDALRRAGRTPRRLGDRPAVDRVKALSMQAYFKGTDGVKRARSR